jgi:hypothetical protein
MSEGTEGTTATMGFENVCRGGNTIGKWMRDRRNRDTPRQSESEGRVPPYPDLYSRHRLPHRDLLDSWPSVLSLAFRSLGDHFSLEDETAFFVLLILLVCKVLNGFEGWYQVGNVRERRTWYGKAGYSEEEKGSRFSGCRIIHARRLTYFHPNTA